MTAVLDRSHRHNRRAELDAVGWSAARRLSYDEWLRQGSRLGVAGRNAAWWIGDWLSYGTACYGAKYSAAARVTGYDRQTLTNMVYVATHFDFSRRRENLSWSHHAELAPLEVEEQENWLDHAEEQRLTVRDLRDELAAVPRPASRKRRRPGSSGRSAGLHGVQHEGRATPSSHTRSISPQMVVCPCCGHEFIPDERGDASGKLASAG